MRKNIKLINPTICWSDVGTKYVNDDDDEYDLFSLVFAFFPDYTDEKEDLIYDEILEPLYSPLKHIAHLGFYDDECDGIGIDVGFYFESKNEDIIEDVSNIFNHFLETFGRLYTLKLMEHTIKMTDEYYDKENFIDRNKKHNEEFGIKIDVERLVELALLVRKFLQEKLENLTDDEKLYLETEGL